MKAGNIVYEYKLESRKELNEEFFPKATIFLLKKVQAYLNAKGFSSVITYGKAENLDKYPKVGFFEDSKFVTYFFKIGLSCRTEPYNEEDCFIPQETSELDEFLKDSKTCEICMWNNMQTHIDTGLNTFGVDFEVYTEIGCAENVVCANLLSESEIKTLKKLLPDYKLVSC